MPTPPEDPARTWKSAIRGMQSLRYRVLSAGSVATDAAAGSSTHGRGAMFGQSLVQEGYISELQQERNPKVKDILVEKGLVSWKDVETEHKAYLLELF